MWQAAQLNSSIRTSPFNSGSSLLEASPGTTASAHATGTMLDGIRRLERKLKYFKEAAKVYVKRGGKPRFGDEVWDNSGGDFRWKRSK